MPPRAESSGWASGIGWAESEAAAGKSFLVTVGQVGAANLRRSLYARLVGASRELATVCSPQAWLAADATLGRGTIIMHRAVVNASARVGNNCIVNTSAIVEHGASIGDHCHVATGAIVNGDVVVEEGCA